MRGKMLLTETVIKTININTASKRANYTTELKYPYVPFGMQQDV